MINVFQFTHPGRGATGEGAEPEVHLYVSIHAPREGCDVLGSTQYDLLQEFQFTHPGRGATKAATSSTSARASFNSRTPGGVRRAGVRRTRREPQVSIHAPREGCDSAGRGCSPRQVRFNSRTPGGVRLGQFLMPQRAVSVSIHAPREGCDLRLAIRLLLPRVSIHAPREGCDSRVLTLLHPDSDCFNSRTPGGVRPPRYRTRRRGGHVSIHAPREGCDDYRWAGGDR